MSVITITKQNLYEGDLLLVNSKCPIKTEKLNGLYPLNDTVPTHLLKREAAAALTQAMNNINAGDKIVPVSAYRSRAEQKQIFDTSLLENGTEFTKSFVAKAGQSEHETGLAIDLALKSSSIDFIRPHFSYSGICAQFRAISTKYGFIERYPKNKQEITGIAHEPWHFRYVGWPHAVYMTEQEIVLEEYILALKKYEYLINHLKISVCGQEIEIFFVPYHGKDISVTIPKGLHYNISGNNFDGVIVTIWGCAL